MNFNWAFALLILAVGNVLTPPPPPPSKQNEDVYACPGCNRTFMSASGRRRHFKRQHTVVASKESCQHGCGKSYSTNSHNALKLHERSCERNPNRAAPIR